MDVNSIINNNLLLTGIAALVITLAITQVIKHYDKKNVLSDWYGIIAIAIGGGIGYTLGHYVIHSVGEAGILLGIVAPFIYEKLPDNAKKKLWLQTNDKLPYNIDPAITQDYKHE